MKKSALLFGLLGIVPAFAQEGYRYSSSCPDCGYETMRSENMQSYTMSNGKKSSYRNIITNNFYYNNNQPQRYNDYNNQPKKYDDYDNYDDQEYDDEYADQEYTSVKKVRSGRSSKMRKYFLAHPFFQPAKGRFGSVTDIFYAQNRFKFDISSASVLDIDEKSATVGKIVAAGPVALSGVQQTNQFGVKEDFSFGIDDDLTFLGMLQYDSTKVAFKDWSSGDAENSVSDSGINLFGVGLQYRFVDKPDWIAMVSGHFQHQKDIANTIIGEIKGGYKVNRTTLYGLGRIMYSDLTNGDVYGAFVKDSTGDWLMLSYKTDASNIMYTELGAGVFSVLNKYVTLNGELLYGSYDWHNQISLKGAIGFQPGDNFALNLYASTALYDSAKGKKLEYMNYDVDPDTSVFPAEAKNTHLVYTTGDYEIKDYKEWKIGAQAIFYF